MFNGYGMGRIDRLFMIFTRFKLGTVICMLVTFILGFSIAYLDAKSLVLDLRGQNTELKMDVKFIAKADSLLLIKVENLEVLVKEQNDVIVSLARHFEP